MSVHEQQAQTDTRLSHVTFFDDQFAKTLTIKDMALWDLRDLILTTNAGKKDDLPWLKLASFGDKKTAKGSLRHDENMLSISGIELDYDGKKMPFDDAVATLRKAGLQFLAYTSPSYIIAEPKWRILCMTSRDLPPTERTKLVARVNGLFGGIFSGETFTLSQGYYFGSVNKNPAHRCEYYGGDFIDLRDDLNAGAIYRNDKPKANGKGHHQAKGFEAHLALLGDGPGLDGFHKPLLKAITSYVATHGAGFDRDALKVKLRDAIDRAPKSEPRPYLNTDKHLDDMIDSAVNKFGSAAQEIEPGLAPAFSEEDFALQFAARHAADARYVAAWGKWFRYDGNRWKNDETREMFSLARKLCREVASRVNKLKDAKAIANAKTRAAVISLAGEDRRLAATVDQWDADPWLLNTSGGVVDLRNGMRRDHRGDDYMTKITSVAQDAERLTPLWDKFLHRVTDKNKELQAFLQRVLGYSLTGVTNEHALFFLHGGGADPRGPHRSRGRTQLGVRSAPRIGSIMVRLVASNPRDLNRTRIIGNQ